MCEVSDAYLCYYVMRTPMMLCDDFFERDISVISMSYFMTRFLFISCSKQKKRASRTSSQDSSLPGEEDTSGKCLLSLQ
jgi:hypothetical protein